MAIAWFHTPNFSLRQLQYAVAIEQEGSFGGAARACGVSQPSLSAQVAKLEAALGLQLFERHARRVLVTAAGHELLDRMRSTLDGAQELADAAKVLTDPGGVTLRVGVIPTVAPYLLPPLAERLRQISLSQRVHWLEMKTPDCERALADGELDAMIIADPPTTPGVEHVALGWEPFSVLVPQDHALRGQVDMSALIGEELLLLEDGHCLREHAMAMCMWPGTRESPYRATSLTTLVQMVASGLGVSVLPASAVPVEVPRARVRAEPFADDSVGRTLRMAWRARSPHGHLLRALAKETRATVAALVAQGT